MSSEAKQTYKPGSNFQISSLSQLKNSSDKDNYTWEGRTLTSWTKHDGDKEPEKVSLDSEINMTSLTSYLSGHWDLNKYGVSAYIPTGGGKIEVKTKNEELPLFSSEDIYLSSETIGDGEKCEIYYDSQLSIDLKPDQGKYPQALYVNGVRMPITQTYVYNTYDSSNNEIWKTAGNQFEVSSEYGDNEITDFLSVTSTNGTVCLFDYPSIEQPLKLIDSHNNVENPFVQNSNISSKDTIASIVDSVGKIYELGSSSMRGCYNLSSVSMSKISAFECANTFQNCSNLICVDLPELVSQGKNTQYQTAGYHFKNCRNLRTVNLPKISSVGTYTFNGCNNLISIDLPSCVIIKQEGFGAYDVEKQACSSLTCINVPMLTAIDGICNFDMCTNLPQINVHNVKEIPTKAFKKCYKLSSIDCFQANVIGNEAFAYCASLKSIDIPNAIKINNQAFYNCPKLSTMILSSTLIVPTLNNNAFGRTEKGEYPTITCVIKDGMSQSYSNTSPWNTYSENGMLSIVEVSNYNKI